MTGPLATAYVAIVPTTRNIVGDLTRQLTPAANQAGGSAGQTAGRSFASKFAGAAKAGTAGVVAGIAAIAGAGIKGAAALEQTTTAFTSLLGSSQAAQTQIAALQKFAAATPFSQQDVLGYAQQFYSFADAAGLAKDQVIPFLTTVGNVGAVTGASTEGIHNAVMALGQMAGAGKISLDNLNQISDAFPGFNAAAAIAAGTGQSTAEVMDQISKGTLDAKTGISALILGMQQFQGASGAMAAQANTLNGLFSTFKDTFNIAVTQAFEPLIPTIKRTLDQLTPVIQSTLNTVAPAIVSIFQSLAPAIGPLLTGLGQILTSTLQAVQPIINLFSSLVTTVGPPFFELINTIMQALTPFVKILTDALQPVLPQIADAFKQITPALAEMFTALAPLIEPLTKLALSILPPMIELLDTVGVPVIVMFAHALTGLAKGIQIAIDAMKPLLIVIERAYQEAVDLGIIGEVVQGTGSIAAETQQKIAEGYYHIGDALGDVLGDLNQMGSQDLSGLINQLGMAAGVALGLANALGAAGAATLGLNKDIGGVGLGDSLTNNLGGIGVGGAIGNVGGAIGAGLTDKLKPKAPVLPPFDKSTLNGFLQTATGTQTNPLTSALNAIFASAKAAGKKLSDGLVKSLRGQNAELIGLTKQRDKIAEDLQKAQQKLADLRAEVSTVRGTTLGTFDVTNIETRFHEPVTVTTILRKLRDAVKNAARFKAILGKLSREGLAPALLQQLAEAGPAALDEARALAAATPKQIGQINSQYKALGRLGGGIGNIAADQMFHGGVQAAQGLVDGLKSKESALNGAIRDLARSMVATLRSTLGIHSPSRVTRGIGHHMGAGLALGIADMHEQVAREGERLANSAVTTAQFGTGGGGKFGAARGGDVFITQNNHYPMAVPTAPISAQRMRAGSSGLGR